MGVIDGATQVRFMAIHDLDLKHNEDFSPISRKKNLLQQNNTVANENK